MDRASLTFCILSLIITIGLISYFYPKAIVSSDKLTGWTEPVQADEIPDIDIEDFGKISIGELIDYYIENPPILSTHGELPAREVRFRGC